MPSSRIIIGGFCPLQVRSHMPSLWDTSILKETYYWVSVPPVENRDMSRRAVTFV
jgi:hypothetical protein